MGFHQTHYMIATINRPRITKAWGLGKHYTCHLRMYELNLFWGYQIKKEKKATWVERLTFKGDDNETSTKLWLNLNQLNMDKMVNYRIYPKLTNLTNSLTNLTNRSLQKLRFITCKSTIMRFYISNWELTW
jgi:hypothetical protein